MERFSFRQFMLESTGNYERVAQQAFALMRAVRKPGDKQYVEDPNLRELVIYSLEEIEQFALRLSKQKDADETNLLIKTFQKKLTKQIKELAPQDADHVIEMFGPIFREFGV